MPFEKGESGNPAGRPKGSKNRSTIEMKNTLSQLIDDNLGNMSRWLNEMAKDDPKSAFQCMLNLMEFHIPKMSRVAWVEQPTNEKEVSDTFDFDELSMSVCNALNQSIAEAENIKFSNEEEKYQYIEKRGDEILNQNK